MDKQTLATIETLKEFLTSFDCAFYAIEEPVSQLNKFFDIKLE